VKAKQGTRPSANKKKGKWLRTGRRPDFPVATPTSK
jgi:hypothetical protein